MKLDYLIVEMEDGITLELPFSDFPTTADGTRINDIEGVIRKRYPEKADIFLRNRERRDGILNKLLPTSCNLFRR